MGVTIRIGFLTLGVIGLLVTGSVFAASEGDYLSEAAWQSGFVYSVYDPAYGRELPEVRRNQNGQGHPLSIRGKTYAKGFGCWRYSIIEMNVPAGAVALSAVAGIDDEKVAQSGDTCFSIWADGKRLWQSPALSHDDPAIQVRVPLKDVKQIKLITDAQGYENYDLADWCEVRWEHDAPPSKVIRRYLSQPGDYHVRVDLHPFHLAYSGEDLPVEVVAGSPDRVEVTYTLVDDNGVTTLRGRAVLPLAVAPTGEALGVFRLPLSKVHNGLYQLKLAVASKGNTVAQRDIKLGLIDSHFGKPTHGSIYGVNHHEFIASYEPLAAAGIEWSRQWFCWAWIEPRKGEWHWDWHDERIAAAKESGIKTIGVLGGIGQPAWTSPDHLPQGYKTTSGYPVDLSDWDEYVRRVATRYRGQVQVWESWNEISYLAENNREGWSIPKYVELHRRAYRILKEIDPKNKVLVSADSLKFVDRCLEARLGDAFDGIVIHPYRSGSSPEAKCANYAVGNVGDVLSVFDAAQTWLAEHKRPDAEVWATEIGWALTGADWPTVSAETHGQYLARTYLLAQASGKAANVCWHDFALGMFGICDGQGYPRPAILNYAGLVSRLAGAVPVTRYEPGGRLHGFSFRRGNRETLALWSETGVEFAMLKPAAELRADLFDSYGNAQPFTIARQGKAIPITGRVIYLEIPSLEQVAVSRVEPVRLTPQLTEVVAGHEATVTIEVENLFGASSEFIVRGDSSSGLSIRNGEQKFTIPRRQRRSVSIHLSADRNAVPGERVVPFSVILPGGFRAPYFTHVRIVSPMTLTVEPFDCRALSTTPTTVHVMMRNCDNRPLSGEVTLAVPDGFSISPTSTTFTNVNPSSASAMRFTLTARRAPMSADALALRVTALDGAREDLTRSLAPVILDTDNNGLADGWKINPENIGNKEAPNIAEVSIEPGHAEFFCQKIHCPRFTSGWIILHRDGQDRIVKGKRYRVTFWARQRDIEGAVGVAVYNLKPWECCGIESQFKIGVDWQKVTTEFTAVRDSDNARFEFFFTETGTLWIEGMRLEEAVPP